MFCSLRCEIHATFLARNETYLVFPGIARLSEIPVKDVVIVVFMLSLWAYSIALIVRAWAKLNLNAGVQGEWGCNWSYHCVGTCEWRLFECGVAIQPK